MTDFGIKVSKPLFDVNTAADKDMILTSKYPFLKAYLQGSFDVVVTAAGVFTNTISHNFGYKPAYLHLVIPDPNTPTRRTLGNFAASALGQIRCESYITTTDLTIGWQDTSAGFFHSFPYTVHFYYYLFYDKLE